MNLNNDITSKRIRASSARPPVNRPLSGHDKVPNKTEFIQSAYQATGERPFAASTARKSFHLMGSKNQTQSFTKYIPKKPNKDIQQLFEQNLQLRKKNHKLTEQLAILKGQLQAVKKPAEKMNQKLNMEFQKQIYWTGSNAHLVTGVKAQYQKLKQQYEAKCEQCKAVKNDAKYLQFQEAKIYTEQLQNQNLRLTQKLQKYTRYQEQFVLGNRRTQNIDYLIVQLQQKLESYKKKLHNGHQKNKSLQNQVIQKQQKIQFLENLVIEKDNSQHHANRKARKLQKQKLQYEQQATELKSLVKETNEHHRQRMNQLKENEQKKYEIEKEIFDRTLQQKESQLQKLEKEVAYLSTLLSYWKPLDEINREVAEKLMSQEPDPRDQQKGSVAFSQSIKMGRTDSALINNNMVPVKNRRGSATDDALVRNEFVVKNDSIGMVNVSRMNQSKINQSKLNPSKINQTKSNQVGYPHSLQQAPPVRIPQKASLKHSESAQRKRIVSIQQVRQIGLLLKYRFIAQKLTISDVKKYFDYLDDNLFDMGENQSPKLTDQPWGAKYITMEQVKRILKTPVFNLGQQQAHHFARYLVQDSNEEFVYCDQTNQIQREIVKSIIKAAVGDYEIYDHKRQQEIQCELRDTITKYKDNIGPALKTVAPKGLVTQKKFFQMVSSLGIEISQQCKELFIARMAMESENLLKLNYKIFF